MDTQLRVNDTQAEAADSRAEVDAGAGAGAGAGTGVEEHPQPARQRSRSSVPKLIQWLPILFAVLLAGNFYYQWRYAEDFPFPAYNWNAHWITSPYKNDNVACFRKTFYLPDRVTHATLFLSVNDLYQLSVNGNSWSGSGESWGNLPKLQTPYSEMGYYRRGYTGTTFNMTLHLHRGKNVLGIFALSWQGAPRIAAQLEVETSTHQEIISDSSWLVAPYERKRGSVHWAMPSYQPVDWPHAVQLSEPVNVPLDIDPDSVQTPVPGILLSPPSTFHAPTVAFRKTIDCSARDVSSYLRIATTSPYDIYINNLLADTTSLTSQYQQSVLTHNASGQSSGVYDAFESIQQSPGAPEYNAIARKAQINVLMMRNMFRRGKNSILLVLHPSFLDPLPRASMDGLVRMEDGRQVRIGAANNWNTSIDNGATWQPPVISAFPEEKYAGISSEYIHGRISPGYTTYIHMVRNDVIGLLICALVAAAGEFWRRRRSPLAAMRWPLPPALALMSMIALPASVWMFVSFIAQSTYRGSPQWMWFDLPEYGYWTLVTAGIVAILAFASILTHYALAARTARRRDAAQSTPEPIAVSAPSPLQTAAPAPVASATNEPRPVSAAMHFAYKYGYAIAMVIVAVVVGAFATYNLAAADFLPDEYTTLMAARGIIQHGMPIYPSTAVIYSRSAIYHYILAGCMILAHSTTNPFADRITSAFWHICTTILVYFIGREMKGRAVGVVSALVFGLSPFMLYYAREARFYAQFVFFATLFFYNLYRAVRNPDNPKLRAYASLSYFGAYASQEFSVTLLPAWALIVVLSGQTRLWLQWRTLRWITVAFGYMALEFVLYTKYCVTPILSVDQETILLMSFHADNLDQIPSMLFSGNERSDLALGILYFAGLIALIFRPLFQHKPTDTPPENQLVERRFLKWNWWNYSYLYITIAVTLTTMLTPHPANRYVCHMFAPLVVCAVCVAFTLGEWLYNKAKELSGVPAAARFAQALFVGATLCLCLIAQRPDRVWHNIAYSRILNRGTTLAVNYVHQHIQPGDKTLFFATDLGTIVLNQCDYFWRPPANSVFVAYMPNGRLVERDSGAVLVDNVDKIRNAMESCKRLWVVVPRPTLLPGSSANGQMAKFVSDNFVVQYESSGMEVVLYDKSKNHYVSKIAVQPDDMYYY